MGCNCKKKKQQQIPEPENIPLNDVLPNPEKVNQSVTDLTEQQQNQVDQIIERINELNQE